MWQQQAGALPSGNTSDLPWITFETAEAFGINAEVPPSRMLTIGNAPVNQGSVPCCVGVALTTAMRFVGGTPALSALFNYHESRTNKAVLDDVPIADGFRAALNKGVCLDSLHPFPFDAPSALKAPSVAALNEALGRKLVPKAGKPSFGRVNVRENLWKAALGRSLPVLFGFFMSAEYDQILSGIRLVHDRPTTMGRGHAVLAVGYDDTKREFTVRDSRGSGIGVAGTWQLPYARLAEGFIYESWVISAVP